MQVHRGMPMGGGGGMKAGGGGGGNLSSKELLRKTMDIAYQNRWVAEWLFPTMKTGNAHPPLTPESFQQGLCLSMSHTLNEADHLGHMKGGLLRGSGSAAAAGGGAQQKLIMHKETNLLVVPVCGQGSTMAGYVFCNGHKYTQMTGFQPVTHMSGALLTSRFVYDILARRFLVISPIPPEGIVGIFQMVFHCDGSCERNFIQVPYLHYTADDMPRTIITSQCNLETRDLNSCNPPPYDEELRLTACNDDPPCAPAATAAAAPPPPLPALSLSSGTTSSNGISSSSSGPIPEMHQSMDDLLHELTSMERPLSPLDNFPLELGAGDPTFDPFGEDVGTHIFGTAAPANNGWPFTADGTTPDGITQPRKPGRAETSAGAFDMTQMAKALGKLERNVKGSFFCLRAKKDVLDPSTGDLLKRQTGHQISVVCAMPASDQTKLREIAAQTYYAMTLSARIDAPLLSPIQSVASGASGASSFNSQIAPGPLPAAAPPRLALPPKRSTIAPRGGLAEVATAAAAANGALGAHGPIDKAEAKKIRNRLSAAKSNQRRRAQLEAQRKELESLQQRVVELKHTKSLMEQENGRLRTQVFGPLVGEL